jgi:peptidase E
MNHQQPVHLFAGGRGRTIFSTFSEVRKIIRGIDKPVPVLAFVGVASFKDNWLVYALLAALIKTGCRCRIRRVVIAPAGADLDKAKEILLKADAVFMSGGDVEAGMQVLQEKKMVGFFQKLAARGQLFIGASAGSIMLSREWVRWKNPNDDSSAELFPCLGIADLICDTHAEADHWAELKTTLNLKKTDMNGFGITSGACLKVWPDGRLEAIGGEIIHLESTNGQIEHRNPLKPAQ